MGRQRQTTWELKILSQMDHSTCVLLVLETPSKSLILFRNGNEVDRVVSQMAAKVRTVAGRTKSVARPAGRAARPHQHREVTLRNTRVRQNELPHDRHRRLQLHDRPQDRRERCHRQ